MSLAADSDEDGSGSRRSATELPATELPAPGLPAAEPTAPERSAELDTAWSALLRIGIALGAERNPDRLVQLLTDEATRVVGAQFGAFFENRENEQGESYMLYTLSGVPREAFARFPMPRNTALFGPTFRGEGVVRIDDVRTDPRFGKNAPYHGMPEGHLPVTSYLAVPVMRHGGTGEVVGGLFFGHAEAGRFGEREARLCEAIAAQATIAIENARLFRQLSREQELLRASEVKHRLVAEASNEGIWFWDVRTDAVTWNDRLLAMLDLTRETWAGDFMAWFERVHPDDQPVMKAALEAHLARRAPYDVPRFRLRGAGGEYRICATRGQAEWSPEGEPLHMAGAVIDVTDKVRAEEALEASEHRYRQILDSVRDMVFCKDPGSRVVYANRATCEHYGMDADALRGVTDVPFNQLDFTQKYLRDDRRVFEEGVVVEDPAEPNVRHDGATRYFHVVKSPIRDRDGRVVELVGVARDVTELRQREEDRRFLADASATLSASIELDVTLQTVAQLAVPRFADWCAVDLVEEDGSFRRLAVAHVDPAKVALAHELARRWPIDPAAESGVPGVVRKGTPEIHPVIDDALLAAVITDPEQLALMRGLGLRSSMVLPLLVHGRAVGAITMVSAESGRIYDPEAIALAEELARRAAVAVENARLYHAARAALEERDRALDEVRELNAQLERRVAERTRELEDANRELESFSYTVSHDLRAPIRHVAGFVDLLSAHAGDRLDDKGQRWLRTIGDASRHMGTLIDALLAFSRMGRAELARVPVPLGDVVRDVLAELEPEIAGRRIEWVIGELPVVRGDPTMLRLVMTNLISNAVKYTRSKEPARIEIASARGEAGEHEIRVSDDGVGFDMTYAHKLFGVFSRLHSDPALEGTGIGLATVRRIVHRHGGRVWARGEPGRGATFSFTLPAEPGEATRR